MAWCIWRAYDREVIDGTTLTREEQFLYIQRLFKDYKSAFMNEDKSAQSKRCRLVSWNYSPIEWWKLNTDGGSLGNLGPAGAVGLIRDDNGFWGGSFSSHIGFGSNMLAELWALIQGLLLA